MAEKHHWKSRLRLAWLRSRGVLFWAPMGTVGAVLALLVGSQVAHNRGQSVEWYAGFGQWLGGLGSIVAAAVALSIATIDRRERRQERKEAEHAQARLVQIEVTRDRGSPDFEVEIHNYGDRAIIGAAVVNAWWFGHPEYSWRHSDAERDRLRIVQPERDAPGESVRISFDDAEGNAVPKLLRVDGYGCQHFDEVTIMPDAVVVFMDANGNLWQTGSSLAPRRIDSPPESQ